MLTRNGREQPLIPRYFDLLVFLIERRGEAVHRRDIFDRIWSDVIVSDSALSQAIRTIRRVLDDDSREPRFVRTVSRHGYQFVFADVGHPLAWVDASRTFEVWRHEVQPHLAEPDSSLHLDDFAEGYAYLASLWSAHGSEAGAVVLMEKHH